MTVQEFFKDIPFDEIAAALQHTHFRDVENFIGSSAEYKEAYDQLCNIVPDGDGGEVTFDIYPREDWDKPQCTRLSANNVEGDKWENLLKKEVVKPSPNPFTDADLAGAILWSATFYGFTPATMDMCFDEMFNDDSPFAIRAYRLEIREMLPYIKDKTERRELKKLSKGNPDGVPCSIENMKYLHERRKHLNRSKRKREYRITKRVAELWNMNKHYHRIERLYKLGKIEDEDFVKNLVSKIYYAQSVNDVMLGTFTYGKISRIDYIKELLGKYAYEMKGSCTTESLLHIIIWSSEFYPLNRSERTQLQAFIKEFLGLPSNSMQIVFGNTKADDSEIQIQFINIKKMKSYGIRKFDICRRTRLETQTPCSLHRNCKGLYLI